jgi:DNA-binding NarL/FixJ family response regulator
MLCPTCPYAGRSAADDDHFCPHLAAQLVDRLSRREREVLDLLGIGLTNREIAHSMCIAERTVRAHVTQALIKLGVHSRLQAGLVAMAARISSGLTGLKRQ